MFLGRITRCLYLVKLSKHRGLINLVLSNDPLRFPFPGFLKSQDYFVGEVCNSTPYIWEPSFAKTYFGILNVIHGYISFGVVIVGNTLTLPFEEVVVLIQEGVLRG